jgi:ATP-dependent DNA helicase RecQ
VDPGFRPKPSPSDADIQKLPDRTPVSAFIPSDWLMTLQRVFGFQEFRPHQEDIVRAIQGGRDVFAVMPTGGGKSLCYQLPSRMLPGTTLVISPLIALMKDQVDAACKIGLRAAFLNSSQTEPERMEVVGGLRKGTLDLLYVAPERMAQEGFLHQIHGVKINLIAVDEAHCISEWGHDFRPDYLQLANLIDWFPKAPIAAFTATATLRVQTDIIERLRLRDPLRVRASFDRPNLYIEVRPKEDIEHQILAFVRHYPREAGIVYRTTRESVERTAKHLASQGIKALPYHAGLDDSLRKTNQEAFNRDEIEVMVATIAFGMGIDKSNIRYIVHGDLPKNLESYYQEMGRAGRDGEPAHCVLFYRRGDLPKIQYFIDQMTDESEQRRQRQALARMTAYAQSPVCRRRQILGYFGEKYEPENCGTCDHCTTEKETVDATVEAQKILSAIFRTGERFGAGHIVDIVTGANTQRIRQWHHDRLKTYGVGKDRPKKYWLRIVDELIAQEALVQSEGEYPVLQFGDQGEALLQGKHQFSLVQRVAPERSPDLGKAVSEPRFNQELFDQLRNLRRTLAQTESVPPYIIFSDRTLHEMAACFPATSEDLLKITGVGESKLNRYGSAVIETIIAFRKKHPELAPIWTNDLPAAAPETSPVSSGARAGTGTVETTWDLVRQGFSLEEMAVRRKLNSQTIRSHVEALILAGRAVDLDRLVEPKKQAYLAELFAGRSAARLRDIMEASDGSLSWDEIALMKAWLNRTGNSPT